MFPTVRLQCKTAPVVGGDYAPASSRRLSHCYACTSSLCFGQLTPPCRTEKESEISPGTVPPAPPPKDPGHKPRRILNNWDPSPTNDFRDYRKQLSVLDTKGVPQIHRNPPTATSPTPPWSASGANGQAMSSSVWGSFFNDDIAQLSPGFGRPGSGKDDGILFAGDDRRPSVASATTVSSSGSKSSISRGGGFHKRLQNVFGEEFPADSRQNSDTSLTAPYVGDTQSMRGTRNRNNSVNNTLGSSYNSRPGSPASSRPRTPLPSSEVTPWDFQDFKVSESDIGIG
jgi:adenylate cyclase